VIYSIKKTGTLFRLYLDYKVIYLLKFQKFYKTTKGYSKRIKDFANKTSTPNKIGYFGLELPIEKLRMLN